MKKVEEVIRDIHLINRRARFEGIKIFMTKNILKKCKEKGILDEVLISTKNTEIEDLVRKSYLFMDENSVCKKTF
ncbi:hypothetical protein J422_03069 [Methanocaldococcus villosus KIN24-T80]|uniref:Uncharacterized protein n=1 Tax=Methanocaldococcus villosus KIN24-T80 TaxID=1069083 RepID=N6VYV1_9EURY|nr:hypothetical protein [Methanocaldococcus villosus]ENN96307.1 hypothetical protein J422_03069 [Methanocaldococcus villosus KIN24-T80]